MSDPNIFPSAGGSLFPASYSLPRKPVPTPARRKLLMARVVCQVLSRPGRLTLIWSEGDAFFEPYHLSGPQLAELRRWAAQVRERLGEVAGERAGGAAGFALA